MLRIFPLLPIVVSILVAMSGCRKDETQIDAASEPAAPLVRPELSEEDEAAARELGERIKGLRADGKYAEAVPLAEELLELRRRTQGELWWETGDAERLLATLEQIIQLTAPQQHELSLVDAGMDVPERKFSEGKFDEAETLLRTELATRRSLLGNDHPEVAATIVNLATFLRMSKRSGDAEALLKEALAMQERQLGERHPDFATTLNRLAPIVSQNPKEREQQYRRVLALRQELLPEDHPDIATSKLNLAICLTSQQQYAEAAPLYDGALDALRAKLGDDAVDVLMATLHTANFRFELGDYSAAEPHYRESLLGFQRIYGKHSRDVMQIRRSLAFTLSRLGRHGEAEVMFRELLRGGEQFSLDETEKGVLLNNLGNQLRYRGDYANALATFEEALAAYRKDAKPNQAFIATTLANIGGVYHDMQDFERAESVLRQADSVQVTDPQDYSARMRGAAFNLAAVLGGQHQHAEALSLMQDVAEARRKVVGESDVHFLNCLQMQAKFLQAMGRTDEALSLLERALTGYVRALGVAHHRTITAALGLAGLRQSKGDFAGAETAYLQALEAAEKLRCRVIGEELDRSQYSDVIKLSEIGAMYADMLIHLGRPDEALGVIERSRGRALLDLLTRAQLDLVSLARQSGDPELIHSLQDALAAESRARLALKEAEARFVNERGRRTASANSSARLESLRPLRLALADSESRVLIALRDVFPNERPAAPGEVLASLEAGDRLMVLNWTEKRVSILLASAPPLPIRTWQVSSNEKETKALRDLAGQVIADLSQPPSESALDRVERRKALGSIVLPPDLREELLACQRLIVVPHGPLRFIPMEVLLECTGASTSSPYTVYADSGSLYLAQLQRRKLQRQANSTFPQNALLVGDPAFPAPWTPVAGTESAGTQVDSTAWSTAISLSSLDRARLMGFGLEPLPGTLAEVTAIGKLLEAKGGEVLLLSGPAADARNICQNARGKRLLHLATHGYASSFEHPDASGLALAAPPAQSPLDSAFLTLEDLVRNWQGRLTDCEMVVLSACETQRGADRGDGVMALPWGFMFAGASTVVASLWRVDDQTTSLLMPRFYENITGQYTDSRLGMSAGTRMSKAKGLQEAKAWLRSLGRQPAGPISTRGGIAESPVTPVNSDASVDFSDPSYWAGFILLGSPD